jgi:hypothetical protein
MWKNLINSKHQKHDVWFYRYLKVPREYFNENCGNCFLQVRECIYLMRSGNFRNNQLLLDVYVIAIEACIQMDNVDEIFEMKE